MESKTVSLIVFYFLPMPSVWSNKNFLHQKKPAQNCEKKIDKQAQKQQQQGTKKRQ